MLPLFDMMATAQNGAAISEMARRFGLSQEQAAEAVSALMPAFSEGLKRNSQTAQDAARFMQALASGGHASYFDDVAAAMAPGGVAEGEGILGHLFGSKDISRAVAAQAAATTGVGEAVLKQMLPVLATMVMGGLFKQATGQLSRSTPQPAATPGGLFGEMMEQFMRAGQPGARPAAPGSGGPNPFGTLIESMFGGKQAQAQAQGGGADAPAEDPFSQMLQTMFGGASAAAGTPAGPAEAQTQTGTAAGTGSSYADLFGRMFDSGSQLQKDYHQGVESIFDTFLKGMDTRR